MSRPGRPRVRASAAALALLVACASGCSLLTGSDVPTTEATSGSAGAFSLPSGPLDYVALGDSYTAGLQLAVQRPEDPACGRSTRSYPSLLASALDVASFTDASCTGAATTDFAAPQATGGTLVAPQGQALGPGTDLVTLSLGGNDYDLFGKLVGTCVTVAQAEMSGSPCRDLYDGSEGSGGSGGDDLLAVAARIEEGVGRVLDGIAQVSPDARVVVVGYPLFVDGRTCAALGFTQADARWARDVFATLDRSLASAAQDAGAAFLDTQELSQGHDVCGEDPWFAGYQPTPSLPSAWHPGADYPRAVAAALERALTR